MTDGAVGDRSAADATATVVWLADGDLAGAHPPAERALTSWARAHGVVLVIPGEGHLAVVRQDPSTAERVEQLLDRARDSLAARDAAGADAGLDAAGALLRAHPELPQAAWLMAEVERARSTRWRRLAPADLEAADRAWARAEAIDGGRVASVSEHPGARVPAAAQVTIDVPADEGALWDGARVSASSIRTRAGSHALALTVDDGPIWAAWVDVPAGDSILRPSAPRLPACTRADVRKARLEGDSVAAAGVRCPRWVAAAAAPTGSGVRIATCEGARCGALLDWSPAPAWSWPLPERPRSTWPSWATWSLLAAGVGVAAAGVAAAVLASQPGPSETRFVTGGLKSR